MNRESRPVYGTSSVIVISIKVAYGPVTVCTGMHTCMHVQDNYHVNVYKIKR